MLAADLGRMQRIRVLNPVVECDGDEMARVMWRWVKERLILPFLDIPIAYFDLGIHSRDATDDRVTHEAARAVLRHRVGVKCATITADAARVRELSLRRAWPSPNATLRQALDGTVFREPVLLQRVARLVPGWRSPIVVGRHAFGDQYAAAQLAVGEPATVELVVRPKRPGAAPTVLHVADLDGPGVAMAMHNTAASVEAFAHASFRYALERGMPLFLSTKATVLRDYDGLFVETFARVFAGEYAQRFGAAGIAYEHRLIDDMAAQCLKSAGGFVWAAKNYDGDVQSDAVAQGFGSLGLMTSVLVSPHDGVRLSEAAHGTVTRHYRAHQRGEPTSTNPIASIFAWSRGLAHRARLDGNDELLRFSEALEASCRDAVDVDGCATRDLGLGGVPAHTEQFLDRVQARLRESLGLARQ